MRKVLWIVALCGFASASAVAGEPVCDAKELSSTLDYLATVEVDLRTVVAIGSVAEGCTGLSQTLRNTMTAVAHMSPDDRPLTLGAAANPEEDRAAFESACAGWERQRFAARFASEPPKAADAFSACKFGRLHLVSQKEFSAVDVRVATFAVVLFHLMVEGGVDEPIARRFARMLVLPGEVPVKPRAKPKVPSAPARSKPDASTR